MGEGKFLSPWPELCAFFWRVSNGSTNFGNGYLPVNEFVLLLGLLKKMHEFAFCFHQVTNLCSVAVTDGLAFILGQPLVSVHNLETHFVSCCRVLRMSLVLNFFFYLSVLTKCGTCDQFDLLKYCAQFQCAPVNPYF